MNYKITNFIEAIYVRNFRSLATTAVTECGPLNVFIGKNNAGKSTILTAIKRAMNHLASGNITGNWPTRRTVEEFTDKNSSLTMQIGLEVHLNESSNSSLRSALQEIAPQLARSIDELKNERVASFIFHFVHTERSTFQYIESISLGKIDGTKEQLTPTGVNLLSTPLDAAVALYEKKQAISRLHTRITTLKSVASDESGRLSAYFGDKRGMPTRYILDSLIPGGNEAIRKELTTIFQSAPSLELFKSEITGLLASAQDSIEEMEQADIDVPLKAYAGEVRAQPQYVSSFMRGFGEIPLLHLTESKRPIGKKEAEQLLGLKVRRGGPERLQVVQQTVKGLLGVNLDAFQGEEGSSTVEMDVDNFLAEANGAGVREALRVILDLELESPKIVLLEEPEVHLHPGLEYAMHSYLQEKSRTMQIFLTTHSTNFIDTVSLQNIYLVSRDKLGKSSCERVGEGDAPIRIPSELGLRLSTVFMFDKLVFVEGPSDEAVLREIARTMNIDFALANVGFVHMGGVKNFTHYAAEGTLELLARRRVKMWFLVDRDERDEREVKQMLGRLGDRAKLVVLPRREMENFLIDPEAISKFIESKTAKNGHKALKPTIEDVKLKLDESANELQPEVLRLYVEKELLSPVYLRGTGLSGSTTERIAGAVELLQQRIAKTGEIENKLKEELFRNWNTDKACEVIPGALLLDSICTKLGSSFKKEAGDGARLGRYIAEENIPYDLKSIAKDITNA